MANSSKPLAPDFEGFGNAFDDRGRARRTAGRVHIHGEVLVDGRANRVALAVMPPEIGQTPTATVTFGSGLSA